jgi:hypothetical protein
MTRRTNHRLWLQKEAASARAEALGHMVTLRELDYREAATAALAEAGKNRAMQSSLMASILASMPRNPKPPLGG